MSPQGIDAIALAVPVFFLLIGVEWWFERRERKRLYRLNDTLNDLALGAIQQVLGIFTRTVLFAGYVWIFERFAWSALDATQAWVWVVGFLGVDFCYYWFHRISHEVNFLWAAHIVHHQSEEYNLAVALRQSAIQPIFSAPFYWPLAILGLPPKVFLICDAMNTLYQFWIHTRTVGKLGTAVEAVLNTPSHHRVHHGSDPIYIDRNHGGTFIVWDRLFGSFQEELHEPHYGVTRPLASWNPLWANWHYWAELFRVARKARRWRDKVWIFFANPAWRPADVPFEPVPYTPIDGRKYDARPPEWLLPLAVFEFLAGLAVSLVLLWTAPRLEASLQAGLALFAVAAFLDSGALFDRRSWVVATIPLRWLVAALTIWSLPLPERWLVPLGFLALFAGGTATSVLVWKRREIPAAASAQREGDLLFAGEVASVPGPRASSTS